MRTAHTTTALALVTLITACDQAPTGDASASAQAQTPQTPARVEAVAPIVTPRAARPPAFTATPEPPTPPVTSPTPKTPPKPPAPPRAPEPPQVPPALRARSMACAQKIQRTLAQIARHEEAACHIMHDRLQSGLPMPADHPTRTTSMCNVYGVVDGAAGACRETLQIWQKPTGECARLLREQARSDRPMIEAGSGYWAHAKYAPMRTTLQRDQSLTIDVRLTIGDCRSYDHDQRAHLRAVTTAERALPARRWIKRAETRWAFRDGDVIITIQGAQTLQDWGYPVALDDDAYSRLYAAPAQRKIIAALESCALGSPPR